jgi:hypothetical protein
MSLTVAGTNSDMFLTVCNIEQPEILRFFMIRLRVSRAVSQHGR